MHNLRLAARLVLAASLLAGAVTHALADDAHDFFTAVQMDSERAVASMMAKGFDPNTRDPRSGEPALVNALREDSMSVFKALLANPRIQLELPAPNGNTALMMAAYKRNLPAAQALLAKGAAINRAGWSPLHYAAAGGSAEVATLLLERGAKRDALAPGDLTPLMMAAREGQEELVQLLLKAGANASLRSGEKLTALQLAQRADKPRIVAMLQGR